MVSALEGYPFDRLTERYGFRAIVPANWKIFMDALQEQYHAPIVHRSQRPENFDDAMQHGGFEALHYQLDGPHRMFNSPGIQPWKLPDDQIKPSERLLRSGLFGPWDDSEVYPLTTAIAGIRPGGHESAGVSLFEIWPNFGIQFWQRGWFHTYHHWPISRDAQIFECNLYFAPARNAARARGARDDSRDVQGVRAPGRQPDRVDPDDARRRCADLLPARRPGDPGPPSPQDRARLGGGVPPRARMTASRRVDVRSALTRRTGRTQTGSVHRRVALNSISSLTQSLDEDLALWADLGIDYVGVITPKLDAPGWDAARQTVLDAGLRVSSISCYPGQNADALEFAAAVNARVLYVVSGSAGSRPWEEAAEKYCEEMAPLTHAPWSSASGWPWSRPTRSAAT